MSKYSQQVNTLLIQIKDGDKSKMSELFDLTRNHLRHVALHYLVNKKDCDDAVSETYFRVVKYIATFDARKDGYNWICRIVQNVAMDMNKEHVNYVSHEDSLIDDFSYPDEIDGMLTRDALYQYVKTLSQVDRQIIYYRYYLDLPYDAIAKKLNRAKSFVHSRSKILSEKIMENFEKSEKF